MTSVPSKVIANTKSDDISIAAIARLKRQAAVICNKFEDVLCKFADVHHAINHSNPLTDSEIQRIGKASKSIALTILKIFKNVFHLT